MSDSQLGKWAEARLASKYAVRSTPVTSHQAMTSDTVYRMKTSAAVDILHHDDASKCLTNKPATPQDYNDELPVPAWNLFRINLTSNRIKVVDNCVCPLSWQMSRTQARISMPSGQFHLRHSRLYRQTQSTEWRLQRRLLLTFSISKMRPNAAKSNICSPQKTN